MSKIIPLGHIEEESQKSEREFFWVNPMVPWWVKLAARLRPELFSKTGKCKPTWCKWCGRKHDRSETCERLAKVEDRTVPPTKQDEKGNDILNTPVGYYSTKADA